MGQEPTDSNSHEDEEEDDSTLQGEWWEMLDWNEMKRAWKILPEETKELIRNAGLAPDE